MPGIHSTETPSYAISVNIFDHGDASLHDSPAHVSLALYDIGRQHYILHQVCCTDGETFFYDQRVVPIEPPILWGRAILREWGIREHQQAHNLLTGIGTNPANDPEIGRGNCQNWVAGAVRRLEAAGLLRSGEGQFWDEQVGCSGDRIGERCLETGRSWIPAERKVVDPGEIDAQYSDEKVITVGELADNPTFQATLKSLGHTQ